MAYTDFHDIDSVTEKYELRVKTEDIFPADLQGVLPAWLVENLRFALEIKKTHESEAFYRESLIYPILQEGIKRHRQLNLWSHHWLKYDEDLSGYPDYFISVVPYEKAYMKMSPPYVTVVEAKDEKFEEGWGQCLAAMVSCQKLNETEQITIYGSVTNGMVWEFGKLDSDLFTKHPFSYTLAIPEIVMGIWEYIFTTCEHQTNHDE